MNETGRWIQDFARSPSHSQLGEFASYGPAIVIPLLKAHERYCDPDHRESVIAALGRIRQPIMREIVEYLTYSQAQCARGTAFEALEERAVEDKEDLQSVIRFFETLHNDRSGRIRNNVEYAIENVRRTSRREIHRCAICGRATRYTFFDPDRRKLICGYCRGI
jgi:HEAT repeat protein